MRTINYTEALHLSRIYDGDYGLVEPTSIFREISGAVQHRLGGGLQVLSGNLELLNAKRSGTDVYRKIESSEGELISRIERATADLIARVNSIIEALEHLAQHGPDENTSVSYAGGEEKILNTGEFKK